MIEKTISNIVAEAFNAIYSANLKPKDVLIQKTRKDFQGDYTINVFPFLKISREKPEITAGKIGEYLINKLPELKDYNVIKGFLNIVVSDQYWITFLNDHIADQMFGRRQASGENPTVIEYSSPNTNKPMHLGHIRNNLLGSSIAEILKAAGHDVVRVNLINDRGIHISKSMLAWQKWFIGITPSSENLKGDKLVGDCYVKFNEELKSQAEDLMRSGVEKGEAEKNAPLMLEAQEMLSKWENNDPGVRELWTKMNAWVYEGFEKTYKRLGVDFDKVYYESDTYLLGKSIVEEGLKQGILIEKEDGSVWADLSEEGLDEKLLLRADGTSVYMTQDLGTAQLRHDDYHPDKLLYVVGNEQNYHFDVLKIVLKRLGRKWAEDIVHVSYGMVELPHGKMKSREGTVVDADELMDEMYHSAEAMARELGKAADLNDNEASELFETISLGALKYFILRVDPKKNMLFNPEESIDFNGNTGPFIQYTYARIQSLLKKAEDNKMQANIDAFSGEIFPKEKEILKILYAFPATVREAAAELSPAIIANYSYELAREYNQFYQEINILRETDTEKAAFRLGLSLFTAKVIESGMKLLGIAVPQRM
ncbi:MAG: arginine--tRNA ligase [Bacteroidetes bacterium]|nr:arginine--tRNA ligase [Bacteroidota bacterium]